MKTVNGSCFSHEIHHDYSIFEPGPEVDEITRDVIAESLGILSTEYDHPFGIINLRCTRPSIDLLAARQLIQERAPHLVAAANVTNHPETAKVIEYEKTVVDHIPTETFATVGEAVVWLKSEVRKEQKARKAS